MFTAWMVLVFWTLPVCAEPIVVVTENDTPVTTLTREQVADLFLGRHNITVAGQYLTPLDVSDDSLRDAFYQAVAGISAIRVNAYWARMVFSARGRPPQKLSLEEVKKAVLSGTGLVTYLPADDASGFKIVLTVK